MGDVLHEEGAGVTRRKKPNPYRSLIAIPIMLVIDVFVVYQAFKLEMNSRPENVLGHPSGMVTVMAAFAMFLVTLVVVGIALIIMAVRVKRAREEE